MKNPMILIAQRDKCSRQELKRQLAQYGFDIVEAEDRADIPLFFKNRGPDLVVICSMQKSAKDGLNIIDQIRECDREIPIVLITRHSSEANVIAALRAGANDYFKCPYSFDELVASIRRNLSIHRTGFFFLKKGRHMIAKSRQMMEIKDYLLKVATTGSTVFITGETGTGKELVAEFIHYNSLRHKKPFICINCAALPESLFESELFGYERGAFTGAVASRQGKLELASGGTVLLDEVGDMSPFAQAKILRAIESKQIQRLGGRGDIPLDIRIIAATNKDPEKMVASGGFRKDLYYRLNVARVHLPPLRDRKEDILPLLDHYISELNERFGSQVEGFTEKTLSFLLNYDWPGNIRELKNLMEATFINLPSKKIALMNLPKLFQEWIGKEERVSESEHAKVLNALFVTNWNKSKAAQKLHCSRMTLYRKMMKYHIISSTEKENEETLSSIVT